MRRILSASSFPAFRGFPEKLRRAGHTLIELLVTLGAISGLVAFAIVAMQNTESSTGSVKLTQDVAALNRAIRQYELAGGSLTGVSEPAAVISKLKTVTTGNNRLSIAGLRGSMVDPRLAVVMQTPAEAASPVPRAVYRPLDRQFEIVNAEEPGVRSFILEQTTPDAPATEQRIPTYELAKNDKWIWDYRDNSVGRTVPQNEAIIPGATTPVTSASNDKLLTLLDPPLYSRPPGTYALRHYPLTVSLINTNSPEISEILYNTNEENYRVYTSPFVLEPGASVAAFAMRLDPDNYADSGVSGGNYQTVAEHPALQFAISDTNPSYVELGGPMLPDHTSATPPAALLSLVAPEAIPAVYQNSNNFMPRWTLDGSAPLTSGTARNSPAFSEGYPGDTIPLQLSSWPRNSDTWNIRAAVKTARPDLIRNSEVSTLTLTREVLPLRVPVASFGERDVTLTLTTEHRDLPVGSRIFYTTNGTDPGDNGGEPVSGTLYSGPFMMEALDSSSTRITARVYPPADFKGWFTPSPTVTGEAPSTGRSGGYIAGDFAGSVARLKPDGTVDPAFNAGAGTNGAGAVRAMTMAGNGLIVGGDFTTFGGMNRSALAKLNASGVLDAGFAPVIEDSPASTPFTLDFAALGLQANVPLNGSNTKSTSPGDPTHGLSPNGGFAGFGSQTFQNLNGSGIDVTLHYSQNMSDADPGVNAHDGPDLFLNNPDARVTGASPLRITNDRFGTITPATVGLSFSEPVLFDSVIIGNLSGTETAAEHGLLRAWSGANAEGSIVAASSAVNISAENGPLLGTAANPATANAASNLSLTTPGGGVYLATGAGSEAENRYGRARFAWTANPVRSLAFSNWTTSTTPGTGGGGHDPAKPFGVAQDFSIFSYTDIDLLSGGGGTVGGVAAGGNLTYGANGGFWMGGVAGRDALVVNGVLTASGGNGSLANGNAVYGSSPNPNQINVNNGTKRQGTNILPFADIKAAHLSLSSQWKALPNTPGSSITYGTPGGDGKVPITLNAGNLTGLVVFNMDASKLVSVAYWNISNVNSAATVMVNIPGATPTLQNFYLSNSGTANKTIFHFPDATTATFSSAGIPGTVFVPKGTVELGSNGSQINGQIIANKMNLRSFHNGGERVFTGNLPGSGGGGPPVTTVDGSRGTVSLSLAGFRRTTPLPGKVWAVKPMEDGKILIGGRFQNINGTARKNIARLNANGTLDTSFDPGQGPNGDVFALSVGPNGAIAVGGSFTSWGGASATGGVVVLDNGGTRRTGFASPVSPAGGDSVRWVHMDGAGKVYIGGRFNSPGGGIARLNANGSVDGSFATGSGVGTGTVFSASVQSDGGLLIAGNFTSINGVSRNRIALLTGSGGVKTSWHPGSGFDGAVFALSQRGGSQTILVGGVFSSHGSLSRNKVTALIVDSPTAGSPTWGPQGLNINAVYAVE